MQSTLSNLVAISKAAQVNMFFMLGIISFIWAVNFINWFLLGRYLNILGIYPRNLFGLLGIIFSPILHGNFNHLFFNTFPLFVLGNLILLGGVEFFITVTVIIMFLSGIMVWIIGRKCLHIGASSVIMGYWSFLLFDAFRAKSGLAIILGFVSIYYFGGLLMALFPEDKRTSMEGHISGFIAGILAIYLAPILHPYILPYTQKFFL